MKQFFTLSFLLLILTGFSFGQVTISGSAGINGSYTSLTRAGGAFAAINSGPSQSGYDILITITADITDENGANVLNNKSWNTLSIKPSGQRVVSGNAAAALIRFNSVTQVTLDGLNDGTNSLTIANLNTGNTNGTSTIALYGDAVQNVIKNCMVLGSATGSQGTSLTTATIILGNGASSTGCDNNLIQNNQIGPNGTAYPVIAIGSWGTSATYTNDNNQVTGNNIFDFYTTAYSGTAGVNIGSNSSAWTVSSNKFYQTTGKSGLRDAYYMIPVYINTPSWGGYEVSGNTIGFSDASGSAVMTNSGGNFTGIQMTVSNSAASSVQGNVINGISWTTGSMNASPPTSAFNGIIVNGAVNMGTITGNVFGTEYGTGGPSSNLYFASTSQSSICAFYATTATSCTLSNNFTGAVYGEPAASGSLSFYGVFLAGTGTHTVTSNYIGGFTANSITLGTAGVTTSNAVMIGIGNYATGSTYIGEIYEGNNIMNLTNNSTTGSITGVGGYGAVTGTLSIRYNDFDHFAFHAPSTGAICQPIVNTAASNTATVNISNNVFETHMVEYTGTTGGTGGFTMIFQMGQAKDEIIDLNVMTDDFHIKTSGNITLINNNYVAPENGSKTITNNLFCQGITRDVPGGNFWCYYDVGASPASVTYLIDGNIFGNISTNTTTGSFYGINASDVNKPSMQIINNIIRQINHTGPTFYGIYGAAFGGTVSNPCEIADNQIFGIDFSGVSEAYGIYAGFNVNYLDIRDNHIHDFNLAGTAGFNALSAYTASGTIRIYDNEINDIGNTATGSVTGIYLGGASLNFSVYHNNLNGLASAGNVQGINVNCGGALIYDHRMIGFEDRSIRSLSTSGVNYSVTGIHIAGGSQVNVFRNNICNLYYYSNGSMTGQVNGIHIYGGTGASVYNNTIGRLNAGTSNSTDGVRGISISSQAASSGYNIYYNTVYISATSTGTNFGTSAIYHMASSSSTTAVLDLRNNIFKNLATPSGTGRSVAFRRSGTALGNFASTSNNNVFYAGIPSASNLLFSDGVNHDMTIEPYQARVSPRETQSHMDVVHFSNFTPNDPEYLHIDPSYASWVDNGGTGIGSITTDIDGDIRQGNPGYAGGGTAPDIGADEFESYLKNWNGTISTDWDEPLNWSPSGVPGIMDILTIPAGTPHSCIIVNPGRVCRSLHLNGGVLTIQAGKDLLIDGDLISTNSGNLINHGILDVNGNIEE